MTQSIAEFVVLLVGLYAAAGVVFAVVFALGGWRRLEPHAESGTVVFRLLVMPGAMLLWPWLLVRVIRGDRPTGPSLAGPLSSRGSETR